MIFKDLKQGFPLYVLNVNTMDVGTGTVSRVAGPHITNDKRKLANGQLMMVVDVSATMGNNTLNFELQENASNTMSDDGQFLISPNQEDIANGIRMVKTRCEEYIRNEQHYKELIKKCDALLPQVDPLYRQSIDNEARFTGMQATIDGQSKEIGEIKASLGEMKEMLTKLLKTK